MSFSYQNFYIIDYNKYENPLSYKPFSIYLVFLLFNINRLKIFQTVINFKNKFNRISP